MSEDQDATRLKTVLMGEEGVWKTSIISQFVDHIFQENCVSTISASYSPKILTLDNGNKFRFELWDTAGRERYRPLSQIFFKDADVIILIYDITNRKSFQEIKDYWIPTVKKYHKEDKDYILAIVANKYESTKKEVDEEEALKLAEESNAIFCNVSAQNGLAIDDLFIKIAKEHMRKEGKEI